MENPARGARRQNAEAIEKRHVKRVAALNRLHDSLRNPGTFHARARCAEGFWHSKDVDRKENKVHPLDGFVRSLKEWAESHVAPQVVDVLVIASELKGWTPADLEAVKVLAAEAKQRLEERFAKSRINN